MSGRDVRPRGRTRAAAMVILLATAGCAPSAGTGPSAGSSPLYADPTHGICRTLPFELLETPVGRPHSGFGEWETAFGSVELVTVADTFGAFCEMHTVQAEGVDKRRGLVRVNLSTYPTAAEAAETFDTRYKDAGSTPGPPASDIGVERLTWRDTSGANWASEINAFVLDRNLRMNVDIRVGDDETEAPATDGVRTAAKAFLTESIRRLREGTPRPAPRTAGATAGPTYPAPPEGFCERLPFELFRDRLGDPRHGLTGEREAEGTRSCLRHAAGTKNYGGDVRLWVRHHATAQEALDFHQAHLPAAHTPTAPDGVTLEVDALDWSYRPPAEGQDGAYGVRMVAGNLYLYIDVTGYSNNKVPLVDSTLAPTIAEFLRAELISLRG